MSNYKRPIEYAKQSIETMMKKYKAQELPPKGRFHYHQGVFLSGVYKNYELCKDEKYYEYVKDWVDSIIEEDGTINYHDVTQLDDIQPGILLYPILDRTNDERYKKALDTCVDIVKNFNRNEVGGFWHKVRYPHQMWLDGLYMGGPICAEYGKRFNVPEFIDLVVEQVLLMEKYTKDEETGLWYHAWDCSKQIEWADPVTGKSPEFWGRSIGWVPVAILDDLDFIDSDHPQYEALCDSVRNLMEAVVKFQAESGLWYQVVDKLEGEGNWLETSCSCLFAAAIAKGVRKGIISKDYLDYAKKAFNGIIDSLEFDGDDLVVNNVCVGTGVGDYEHYINRPTSENDLHGVGAFLLMCAEMEQVI
ncbi:MAG: glycoside hydrolase 105 family protein [Clostridiales bacterium]|nr:glycoside hydrolase 105 family protein [Clostridiales bacterium]